MFVRESEKQVRPRCARDRRKLVSLNLVSFPHQHQIEIAGIHNDDTNCVIRTL